MKTKNLARQSPSVPWGTTGSSRSPQPDGFAHTPGPWQCQPLHGRSVVAGVGVFQMASTGADVHAWDMTANARLIAAAPELLEACKVAQPLIEEWLQGVPEVAEQLAAAIAKAGGK